MKQINIIIALVATMLGFASCTHNDGDIGPLFGTWHVESIDVDGTPDAAYSGNLFIMFQSNACDWRLVDEQAHTYVNAWTAWTLEGDVLTLNFADDWYPPHAITGFAPATATAVTVEELSSSRLVLRATSPLDGATRRFTCTKQH